MKMIFFLKPIAEQGMSHL